MKSSCRQIQHTNEEGDKHIRLIAVTRGLVDDLHHTGRIVLMCRSRTEQRMGHSHHHRRRHALATHIANAEEKFLISQEEVEEVTTHLTGRYQRAKHIDIISCHTILLRQHLCLDFPGNMQFALDTLLFHLCRLQASVTLHKQLDDDSQNDNTSQHHDDDVLAHVIQLAKHFTIITHQHNLPTWLTLLDCIIHMPRFATLFIEERKARHTSLRLQFPLHRAVVHHIHNLPDQRWTCQTVIRTRNKIAVFTNHQRERRRIAMMLIHHFAHPIRSHINKQHSHRLSTLVSHRHTISCHHTFRPLCIQIRRRPLHRIAPHGNLIKICLGIIVLL